MAPLAISSAEVLHAGYWTLSLVFGLSSVLLLLLCMKKKKRNSVVMVRYIKNDEMEVEGPRSRASTNATNGDTERKLSQHSIANENRILPDIPKNGGNGINHVAPSTPDQSATPGAVSLEGAQRNSASSPKRSRRLPALPPPGQVPVDIAQAAAIAQNEKDIDDTYEDLRDDTAPPPDPQGEVVGSGDSSLYAKVPEDLKKQEEEESDLYAQVGAAGGSEAKPSTSGTQDVNAARGGSTSSEDDKTMDSPTAVTYASVDKMKKTMSVKRRNSSSSGTSAPPVPDRNFEDEEVESTENLSQSVALDLPPPPTHAALDELTRNSIQDGAAAQVNTDGSEEATGPAYDTVSVRESFAHQRLRQMVEDEQRNRYINTAANSNPRDLYSQIDEENPEAVYESVSVPGSADGTVGVTGRDLQTNNDASTREDGYSTIGAARAARNNPSPPTPPNGQVVNPDYENIDPA